MEAATSFFHPNTGERPAQEKEFGAAAAGKGGVKMRGPLEYNDMI
jgi:hypothetical protein